MSDEDDGCVSWSGAVRSEGTREGWKCVRIVAAAVSGARGAVTRLSGGEDRGRREGMSRGRVALRAKGPAQSRR